MDPGSDPGGDVDGDAATAERDDLDPSRARSAVNTDPDRFSTDEIFHRVVMTAFHEVSARRRALYLSGLSAGLAITVTFFGYATVRTATAPDPTGLLGPLLYPLGFLYIILGRYQLYTENTLTPVTLALTRVCSVPAVLRVWVLVLAGNVSGAAVGAFVLANTGVFDAASATTAAQLGRGGIETPWWDLVFKAVFAGWLVAGVVWLEHAVRDSIARVLLVYIVIYTIPVTGLYHVVVSVCDVAYLVFLGRESLLTGLWEFVIPVLLGNTLGGVFLVTVLNFGQLSRTLPAEISRQQTLSLRAWLFGK
ncbi:formate/nitrite transporter family protein [Halorientalis brevis]|uniref:Formate/nitrite transporter family protein n=1 Tax=Halorientalis brevis TaxID=1126241 RepID=A0ABD6CA42_9EURY|nr:formate/nitrite transporter family protein [Halorientalis brevis]